MKNPINSEIRGAFSAGEPILPNNGLGHGVGSRVKWRTPGATADVKIFKVDGIVAELG